MSETAKGITRKDQDHAKEQEREEEKEKRKETTSSCGIEKSSCCG